MIQIKPMHVASPLGRGGRRILEDLSKELLQLEGQEEAIIITRGWIERQHSYVLAEIQSDWCLCAMTTRYGPDETVNLHEESSRKSVSSASWLFLAMYDKILYKSRKETTEELFHFLAEIRENIKDPGLH